MKGSGGFTTLRDATVATSITTGTQPSDFGGTLEQSGMVSCGDVGFYTRTTSGKTTIHSKRWKYFQSHYEFDSSGISTTVSDLEFKCKGAYSSYDSTSQSIPEDISIIVLKASSGSNTGTALWNDFVGHTSGWDSDDVTEYSSEYVVDGQEEAITSGAYGFGTADSTAGYVDEDVALNSTAKTDIEDNDTFEFSIIDYDQYYSNSFDSSYGNVSSTGVYEQRMFYHYQIDSDTASNRPHLEYTAEGGEAVTYDANFFGANF